jgi:hypothetical protein
MGSGLRAHVGAIASVQWSEASSNHEAFPHTRRAEAPSGIMMRRARFDERR